MPELPPSLTSAGLDSAGLDSAGFNDVRLVAEDELGTNFVAFQTERGQEVAVRLLALTVPSRPVRRQFRSSCLAITALAGGDGVLTVHEADFTADHHPYLVTDVPAGSLASLLAHGPLPADVAAGLTATLASTLIAAHEAGVLHLDLRPANVVRTTRSSAPLLANFGVTRAVSAAGQAELPAECLLHAGRELFGWDTPGPPADVYGLGSTLYTTLAGQPPYAAEARLGRAALYQRVLRGGPPMISHPGIPPLVTALIAAMMDPNPANRPDLRHVTDVLAKYACDTPALAQLTSAATAAPTPVILAAERLAQAPSAPPTPVTPDPAAITPPPPRPPVVPEPAARTHRHTGPMLLIAAGLLALLAGFVWGIVTGSRPEPAPGPLVRATASPSPVSPSQLALYRTTHVRALIRPAGVLVTWSAPVSTQGVNAYLVIPKVPGQRTQSVGRAGRSVIFSGLPSGHRYCFVVVTLIESAAGQASTAATKPVCTPAQPAPKRAHHHRAKKV